MNQPHVHPSRGPSSAVIGAERFSAIRPEPSSRAGTSLSTSVSDIASELSHSIGAYTPSPPNVSASSNNIFRSQDASHLPERPTSQFPNATFPTYASGAAGSPSLVARTSSAIQTPPLVSSAPVSPPPPPPPPIPPRIAGPVTPAPVHRSGLHAHSRSQSQTHSQLHSHQLGVGSQVPPSSARSKVSVAETPSGDLANFHLLNGSPLQSVADFDTPTPSPRTPSMPSVSPADAQAFALAIANGGGGYLPPLAAADHRRFLPGSSISPSVSRAQRAAAGHRSSFYCRICRADPCHDITATACGHVFCNACIVEEVRENARCPVCNAAVLLFAMLKLDLSY
jgi:Zinc finger, C3HC4 type (RING finger)